MAMRINIILGGLFLIAATVQADPVVPEFKPPSYERPRISLEGIDQSVLEDVAKLLSEPNVVQVQPNPPYDRWGSHILGWRVHFDDVQLGIRLKWGDDPLREERRLKWMRRLNDKLFGVACTSLGAAFPDESINPHLHVQTSFYMAKGDLNSADHLGGFLGRRLVSYSSPPSWMIVPEPLAGQLDNVRVIARLVPDGGSFEEYEPITGCIEFTNIGSTSIVGDQFPAAKLQRPDGSPVQSVPGERWRGCGGIVMAARDLPILRPGEIWRSRFEFKCDPVDSDLFFTEAMDVRRGEWIVALNPETGTRDLSLSAKPAAIRVVRSPKSPVVGRVVKFGIFNDRLYLLSDRNVVWAIDVQTGQELFRLPMDQTPQLQPGSEQKCISSDGSKIAVMGLYQEGWWVKTPVLDVYSLQPGETTPKRTWINWDEDLRGFVEPIGFDTTNQRVLMRANKEVFAVEAATGNVVWHEPRDTHPSHHSLSPDGRYHIRQTYDRADDLIEIRDTTTADARWIDAHARAMSDETSEHKTAEELRSLMRSRRAWLLRHFAGQRAGAQPIRTMGPLSVRATRPGRLGLYAIQRDGMLFRIDYEKQAQTLVSRSDVGIQSESADGRRLVLQHYRKPVRSSKDEFPSFEDTRAGLSVWDAIECRLIGTLPVEAPAEGRLSPDGLRVAVMRYAERPEGRRGILNSRWSSTFEPVVYIFESETGRLEKRLNLISGIHSNSP